MGSSQGDAATLPPGRGEHGGHQLDPAGQPAGGLSERERDILVFERQWWSHAGAKEQAIRERFNLSGTRYYQLLNELIDKREALEADPMLVKRLQRLRTARQRARAARRLGIERP